MKAGDTFDLLMRTSDDETSTLTRMEKALSAQARTAELMKQLGFEPDFASTYARAYNDAGFLTQFRVKQMKVTWGEQGVDLAITGFNYVEVRADKESLGALVGIKPPVPPAGRRP